MPGTDQLRAALAERYEIEREIGAGGMATVYLARDLKHDREVAIKVLHADLSAIIGIHRFLAEIRIAANLDHPHILTLIDSGSAAGILYYVLPYVRGESLRTKLDREKQLRLEDALAIIRQVAGALDYAHSEGVVHRDIKPENILLHHGEAVLADFGIALAVKQAGGDRLTQTGLSLGTPLYMSPEQATGDRTLDARSDVYSLAAVFYEMVAGEPPITGSSAQVVIAKLLTEKPVSLRVIREAVPVSMELATATALSKTPADRFSSAGEFVQALTATARVHPAMPAILLGGQRRLATVLGIYAVAVVAVAIVARAAVIALGLPDWVFPGALIVMALGLPVILFTAFVHRGTHRALTQSALTLRGSPATQSTMTRIAVKASPWISWRRTFTGGAVALAGFSGLVAAFMIMRATGIGPVGSLLASGRLTEKDQLLVTDFRGGGADSSLSAIVTEAIRTDLGQSSVVKVVPPSAVAEALGRMRRDRNSPVDLAVAREIAAREGIKGIVDGSVTPLAGGYVVSVRLVDAASGDGLASFRETIDGPSELLPTLDKLSGNLRGKIGESLKKVRANPPLERVTTSSLEALRKYAEGTRAFDVEGDNSKAVTFFREAVAIDTAFGMAYRKLGVALGNAGMPRVSRDSALEAAFRHRFRMTDIERYLTTGSYFNSGRHADRKLSADAFESVLRIDSLNPVAINNLAIALIERRQFARAEAMLRRALASGISRATMLVNLVDAQVRQGKFAAADSTAVLAQRQFPQNATARGSEFFILTARKQFDSLERRADWFRANDPDAGNRSSATFMSRDVAYIRGRIDDGMRLDQEATALEEARGSPAPGFSRPLDRAWVDVRHLEQGARAAQRLDSALAKTSLRSVPIQSRRYIDFAVIYALSGRPDRARQILAEYQSEDTAYRRRTKPEYHIALGEIALAERRPVDAIREFRLGDQRPDGPRDSCPGCTFEMLSRAFDAANMRDSAVAAYTAYVTTPSPFTWPDEYGLARAHLRLGQLHEASGDMARAKRHYETFVQLWKNADPELQPKVALARGRLAAIQKR